LQDTSQHYLRIDKIFRAPKANHADLRLAGELQCVRSLHLRLQVMVHKRRCHAERSKTSLICLRQESRPQKN